MGRTLGGAVATFIGAAVWGLIWLPVHHFEQLGVSGLWAIVLFQPTAAFAALFVLLLKRETADLSSVDNWLVGASMGISTMLYFSGILISDVVRVIFLFYTLPVWAIFWNALLYRQAPIVRHYVVIGLAIAGLWLLLSGGNSWVPRPENIGDWCGLFAGATWGLGLTLLQHRRKTAPNAISFISFCVAFLIALVTLIITRDMPFNATDLASLKAGIPLALLVGIGMQFPVMYAMVWGGQRLTAPTASLLTMSEILAATISASLILGNSLNAASWCGGIIIVTAAVIDIVGDMRSSRKLSQP